MSTDVSIQTAVESLTSAVTNSITRPLYFRIATDARGKLAVEQVVFLTPEQLAELAHVERRTVYSWVERAEKIGLKFYRPPGARGILFELNEVLDWLKTDRRD
jgi:excisionase family DNA binding protein